MKNLSPYKTDKIPDLGDQGVEEFIVSDYSKIQDSRLRTYSHDAIVLNNGPRINISAFRDRLYSIKNDSHTNSNHGILRG